MIQIPDSESTGHVADWVELILATEGGSLSKFDVSVAIERNSGDDVQEGSLTSIWRELDYRKRLYSRAFYHVGDRTIDSLIQLPAPNAYLMCLFLSLFGVQSNILKTGKLFERLSRVAIENYLNGEAIVFGWPFDQRADNADEAVIKQQVSNLAARLNERFYEAPQARFKDRGLDVVGWIPHEDNRSSQLVILLQCGAGHNWTEKNAVSLNAWNQYLHWANDPLRAFAVPCVINERDWHDHSRDKGIIFDRIRLMNLLGEGIDDNDLNDALEAWVQTQIADYVE
jgi:hypothetical protein